MTIAELDSRGPVIRVRADEQSDGAPGLAADITAQSAAELQLSPRRSRLLLGEGSGGHHPSEPVTVQFAGAKNGLNRPNSTGALVG